MTWESGYILVHTTNSKDVDQKLPLRWWNIGFRKLGIHRIQAHCNPDNVASWKLLKNSNSVGKVCCGRISISEEHQLAIPYGGIVMHMPG